MTLVAHDAIRHIQHTLSSDEVPSIGALRILNDAGEYLVNMHNWRWLEGAQVKLDLHKDVDHVWLPDNFREIIGYDATQGLTSGLELTSHQYLVELRSNEVSTSAFRYWAAVTHAERSVAATATLTCDTIPDSDASTIVGLADGYNELKIASGRLGTTFTFDDATAVAAAAETAESRYVVVGATIAASVSNLIDAINRAPALYLRAEQNASTDKLDLIHSKPGTKGNVGAEANWLSDADGKFTGTAMSGGVDGGPVRPRLDIYPTPSSDVTDGLTLYFRRGWGALEGDNDLVSIPSYIESLYLQIVRAFARGYERESEADVSQRLSVIAGGPLVLAARQRDKESQPNLGPMRGGAAQGMYAGAPGNFWNFSSVSGPS